MVEIWRYVLFVFGFRKIMFVIRIGSGLQTPTCNTDLAHGPGNAMVVLQYTTNKVCTTRGMLNNHVIY